MDTCRKIVRWYHFLDVPHAVISKLTPNCVTFLLSLLTNANDRLGYTGDAEEVKAHCWLAGTQWSSLR
jgi:hypothetical protein